MDISTRDGKVNTQMTHIQTKQETKLTLHCLPCIILTVNNQFCLSGLSSFLKTLTTTKYTNINTHTQLCWQIQKQILSKRPHHPSQLFYKNNVQFCMHIETKRQIKVMLSPPLLLKLPFMHMNFTYVVGIIPMPI